MDIGQKAAWFLAHRIRKAHEDQLKARLHSPVEADETYIGGKSRNMHANKRPGSAGMGIADKPPVVAVKSRTTKKVKAKVTKPISSQTLQRMIIESVKKDSTAIQEKEV